MPGICKAVRCCYSNYYYYMHSFNRGVKNTHSITICQVLYPQVSGNWGLKHTRFLVLWSFCFGRWDRRYETGSSVQWRTHRRVNVPQNQEGAVANLAQRSWRPGWWGKQTLLWNNGGLEGKPSRGLVRGKAVNSLCPGRKRSEVAGAWWAKEEEGRYEVGEVSSGRPW